MATAALVCGIIGLVAVPGLVIVAWSLGLTGVHEIDSAPEGSWSNRDHANLGKILGIVSTVLYGLIFVGFAVLYFGFFLVFFIVLAGTT